MPILKTIEQKLQAALVPSILQVADDSAPHYGHDGATPGQVSHVAIRIVSGAFTGKSRVERSRMVHHIIGEEIKTIHALTVMKTFTPEEYSNLGGKFPA